MHNTLDEADSRWQQGEGCLATVATLEWNQKMALFADTATKYEAKIGVLDHGAHLRHSFSLPKIPTLLPLEVTSSNRVENDGMVSIYSDLKT